MHHAFCPEEFWSQDTLRAVQSTRLQTIIEAAARSPFYGQRFAELGIRPEDIRSVDDIRNLPCTTKDDLRAAYPDKMLTLPVRQMARLHASSGTTGAATVVYYTHNDLAAWADLVARCMHMTGIRADDTFQNIAGYGLFTGGLGFHYGAERLGCLTIPAGAGNSKRQLKLLEDFRVTAVHIIPSYALHLASVMEEMDFDPKRLSLRIALIGAEPHTEAMRRRIEAFFGVRAYNSYGLSEMNGPGVAFECPEQNGMHLWEDAYIAEIIDPTTGDPVPEGQMGELVLTTLTREGMPLVRYRTRDLTRFLPGHCPCGRTHRRIDRISGRSDDMIILKGVNIYPMQVESVLMDIPEVGQNYLIVLEREGFLDQMRVKVEVKDEFFVEDMRALKALQQRIAAKLRDEILITPRVDLVESNSLPKSEGKAVRVQDLRPKQ
ncbi:phenylacetate-coenzyme A ligase [Thermodesulfomicrobium sp. WS]|uniref:phenylacetate--CoA ligase family protein n=1 Tax=Thermodesulfomicrobium sp. WS TaxID=3004129 RepID=UPI00249104A7|nr:phenylacetate--CoA ligase [Thermodesulfomicrobium sp. WS]BDV01203.1 phenylacetate-coenzyme A ligase [Thermodesulfomicrobium sp. WS]